MSLRVKRFIIVSLYIVIIIPIIPSMVLGFAWSVLSDGWEVGVDFKESLVRKFNAFFRRHLRITD